MEFTKPATYRGVGGYGKTSGIEFALYEDKLELRTLSKDECIMTIPIKDVAKFLNKLDGMIGCKSRNWQETFYEIVDRITVLRMRDDSGQPKLIQQVQSQEGSCGFYDLAINWTNEFEAKNALTEWDGEFYDEVTDFINAKLGEAEWKI